MLDVDVEQSRANRLERQKARFRDRGGIYVAPATNGLRDILLARSVTGESPVKRRLSTSQPQKAKPKGSTTRTSTKTPKRRTKTTSGVDNDANAIRSDGRQGDVASDASQPVAGPSYSGNDVTFPPSAPKTTNSASRAAHQAPKRRGRPAKSRPVDGEVDLASSSRKPKSTAKSKATTAKKRSLTVISDEEASESELRPARKRPKPSASKAVSSTKTPSSAAQEKRKRSVPKAQLSDEATSRVGRTGTSGRGKGKNSFLGISDDEDEDEEEEWTRSSSTRRSQVTTVSNRTSKPDATREKSDKSKPPTTVSRKNTKSKGDKSGAKKEQKPGRSREEDDSLDTDESPVPTRLQPPPRSKSRFQAGFDLPAIEEESEEEQTPQKPKPASLLPFQSKILNKLAESWSVVERDGIPTLKQSSSSSNEGGGMAKSRVETSPSPPDTRKRQREVDVDVAPPGESSEEDEREPPAPKPARKRAKTASTTSVSRKAKQPVKGSKTPSEKKSRKKGSTTTTTTTSAQKEEGDRASTLTKVTEVSAKIPNIHSRSLKENVDVIVATTKPAKSQKAPTSSKARAVKGLPRSILDRIKVALPPPPADSDDDDPLNFLS